MRTIDFKITFDFFKESVKRLVDFNKQTEVLCKLLDADIYGGPLKSYGDELNMWNRILNNKEKLDIFIAFLGDIIESKISSKETLIYYTGHAQQHIGELAEEVDRFADEEYSYINDKCIIHYPKGKDKYEYIWEILCS